MAQPRKVLVIGSGPIVIGQAAEFDYAGTQACKALREEGVETVLVNSNPATIMTDHGVADSVYIEPLDPDVIARIIERERPDGCLPTLGGQTGLNLAVQLSDAGVFDKYGVCLLGTSLKTIRAAEERSLFKKLLVDIGEPVPESITARSVEEALAFAERAGLPVIVRPSFTLGGSGGGIARTMTELRDISAAGLAASLSHELLVEECILGWKELEYEVMRDGYDNCIMVCNMENIDPMGVHTGDSLVVAPSQTLTDKEHQMLRSASLRIIRALGIEGGCNVQFGLAPSPVVAAKWAPNAEEGRYFVIEVNPRVSRSSALASKVTGYPIARVAAKIAVGRRLDEIRNQVTGRTTAAFEPALDYCAVKIPRWPFDKFAAGDRTLGSQMKATGEVMAIDRSFEAALQKAVRSLEMRGSSLLWEDRSWGAGPEHYPYHAHDLRLWTLMAALRRGATPEYVAEMTGIDPWFLYKLKNIVDMEARLLAERLTPGLLWEAKRLGFSDEQIGTLADRLPEQVRVMRQEHGIRPAYKMVDTCAAEFDASTPYFYSTYEQENEAEPLEAPKAAVIGSGPIRIGQGVEFDYCSVHAAWAMRDAGVKSIMINSNPETVSTDFDTSSRLYFESLDEESVREILENESQTPEGTLVQTPAVLQFGGQTAINLSEALGRTGHPILGSSAATIDTAEDRKRFQDLLERLGIPQPPGGTATNLEEARAIARQTGFPAVVRPSYVLGGRAMEIVHSEAELERYLAGALDLGSRHPVLVDRYIEGREVDVDAICDGEAVLVPGILEHIERAGVHSGDSMAMYPGLNLTFAETNILVDYAQRIGTGLQIKGLMNIQFVIVRETYRSSIYVLEVNARASRTVPFLSKVTSIPMVKVASHIMLGKSLREQGYEGGLYPWKGVVAIKAPVFSMAKLAGVDSYLGPEMKSTGEVMGIDYTFDAALTKALMAAGLMMPPRGAILLSIGDRDKAESLPIIRKLALMDYKLYATEGTAAMLEAAGLPVSMVAKKLSEGSPDVLDVINQGLVDGVVNTISGGSETPIKDGFAIRQAAAARHIPCFTSLDTVHALAENLLNGGNKYNVAPLAGYLANDVSAR